MLLPKKVLIFVLLIIFAAFVAANKDMIIREHLTSAPPTLQSLNKDVETTNKKLEKLNKEFQTMKNQAQAQAADAAAAKAQLEAIH